MDVLAILSWFGLTDPALRPAGITALFGLAGIVLTGLFATVAYLVSRGADRAARRRLREEKTRDLQISMREEVRAHWYEMERHGEFAVVAEQVVADIEDGRWVLPTYTPFITRQAPSVVFDSIRADIALLDQSVIHAAINYYRQLATVGQLAEDMRSDRFAALQADRKIAFVRDYYRAMTALKVGAVQLNDLTEKALRIPRRQRDRNMQAEA